MADRDCKKTYPPLALSSSAPSWWEFHHQATCPTTSTPTSSWSIAAGSSPLIVYDNYNNSKSSPCDHEYPSFTASNHSTFAVDEPFNRFVEPPSSSNNIIITEPNSDNNTNLWSQFILSVEGKHNMQGEVRDEAGENLLGALSLKNFSHGMFEPLACSDYLEKFDSSQHEKWDGSDGDQYASSDANNFFRNYPANIRSSDPQDGPPILVHRTDPHQCNDIILSIDPSDHDQTKQDFASQQKLFSMGTSSRNTGFDSHSHMFDHTRPDYYLREENDHAYPSLGGLFPRESNMHKQHGHGFEPSLLKSLSMLENIKQQKTIIQRREQLPASTSDGKKKRKDDNPQSSSCSLKKLKHESRSSSPSTASSSAKARDTAHTPKVKIAAEKIAALQKIVSPFGKTDTASVLQEAIGFIKCHQEQVQLLSNHYLKSSVNKLQDAWRGMDRKLLDLKSRGLCLVPTASIPQVYIENAGPDYWPAYRGCLYR